ncbi:hypothetical protein [Pseudomonas monteilii]|nr:hypothetical protein [Pseudomonas monteilii]
MPERFALSRQEAMLGRGKARLLRSGDFLTAEAFAVFTHQHPTLAYLDLRAWKQSGNIFSLTHENVEYFPPYAFDPAFDYRPFSPLTAILSKLAPSKHEWAIALWFSSSNSYLGGRVPKDVMAGLRCRCSAQPETRCTARYRVKRLALFSPAYNKR